ncbi:hypothetical protein niasHT_008249 [Heterodera trifolii]|uniref:Integrase zinc-binding domain-containing protein n=1 Tax=Heterodera trifolii TaxID=157864 RepID=A0ABD2M188_9BILA
MKALGRRHIYWPGLDSEIEKTVKSCEECQNAQKNPTKAPLAPWSQQAKSSKEFTLILLAHATTDSCILLWWIPTQNGLKSATPYQNVAYSAEGRGN